MKMGWRDWPAWVKGGIIGLCVGLVADLYALVCFGFVIKASNLFQCSIIIPLLSNPVYPLLKVFNIGVLASGGFAIITIPFVYLLIGALIGFIVGKIKSRKNKLERNQINKE